MILINSIEIKYFRSIYQLKILNLKDVLVLSGKNDAGKSNVLKALNLFFNNQVDWKNEFSFSRDFSFKRLEEVRKTIKGKQFIEVSVGFNRTDNYKNSLPEKFVVTKTWYRDNSNPQVKSTIQRQFNKKEIVTTKLFTAQASLNRFLNGIKFEYVPAIKDVNFFNYMLGKLQDTILGKSDKESKIVKAISSFNENVESKVKALSTEFQTVTNIPIDIKLPNELSELFRAVNVATQSGANALSLNLRGDGIKTRFLPSLFHYISENSRFNYVWGFEEPENNMELSMATKLAEQMTKEYCESAQIILTSHSPAFISQTNPRLLLYRVYKDQNVSNGVEIDWVNTKDMELLEDDIGLLQLQRSNQIKYAAELKKRTSEYDSLKSLVAEQSLPVIITEGITDVLILTEAWKRLHGHKKVWNFIPCGTTPESSGSTTGGADMLTHCLKSHRYSEPIIIGLFDRDEKGTKAFGDLGANFDEYISGSKVQKVGVDFPRKNGHLR
jgi:predicted ATP-dependent endonuclease of OLD family